MRYQILHNGVPIGDVDLDLTDDPSVGIVTPSAGYDAICERVRAATNAFRATAFGAPDDPSNRSSALADGVALGHELELSDEQGQLVKVDFIELADWEGKPLDVTVWVRARGALSGVPSTRDTRVRSDHDSA